MTPDTVPWARVSGFIGDVMGLHFPSERWADLRRGFAAAADEFGFEDMESCAEWLLSSTLSKSQLQVLAGHLTIGETYFLREKDTFAVLRDRVLPELIRSREGRERRLRLWSAACCSGEEAYSLAILVRQLLPDLVGWQVTILATDINGGFLRKALAGAYGEWSFRDTPHGFKERYFTRSADGRYLILPQIKDMVTFAPLNLVEDGYPSLATDTNAMDLILCRNVLMYFTPAQTERVVKKLHHAIVDGGFLVVSPAEASHVTFSRFVTRSFPGVILYQKRDGSTSGVRAPRPHSLDAATGGFTLSIDALVPPDPSPARAEWPAPPVLVTTANEEEAAPDAHDRALSLYEAGRYPEAADALLAALPAHALAPREFSLLARAFANQGKLADARAWCDRWIAADRVDAGAHYLRAIVLLEQGESEEARRALERAIYLRGSFVLAHFALGNLARSRGRRAEAARHFRNALELLAREALDAVLPESDGLTAGRLTETIATLTEPEAAYAAR